MKLKITFSEGTTKTYPDSVTYTIGDIGILNLTDGDDLWMYAPHAWSVIETEVDPPVVY